MSEVKDNEKLSFLQNLYAQLSNAAGKGTYDPRAAKYVKGGTVDPGILRGAFLEHPFSTKVDLGNGITGNSLKNTLGMTGAAIKANPWKSAGLGVLGATNVAGLVDDDKIGGQLVGTLGGGALAHFLPVSPVAKLAIGMGGGTLGSLFDKLRAKKEAEQQAMYQQQEY